jgi:hypothetical protein
MENQTRFGQQMYTDAAVNSNRDSPQSVEETPAIQAKSNSTNTLGPAGTPVVTQILDININRKSMIIFNDTAANLYLAYGDSPGLSITNGNFSYSEIVIAGAKSIGPGIKYVGKVWGVLDAAPAANKSVRITEFM